LAMCITRALVLQGGAVPGCGGKTISPGMLGPFKPIEPMEEKGGKAAASTSTRGLRHVAVMHRSLTRVAWRGGPLPSRRQERIRIEGVCIYPLRKHSSAKKYDAKEAGDQERVHGGDPDISKD
jgi:hypothetical protein